MSKISVLDPNKSFNLASYILLTVSGGYWLVTGGTLESEGVCMI